MDITSTECKGCVHVKAKGQIRWKTSQELMEKFEEILEAGESGIIFDMGDIEVITAPGIYVLMQAQKACKREGGRLVIANIPEDMKRSLLELAGMNYVFEIYDDIAEAVKSF